MSFAVGSGSGSRLSCTAVGVNCPTGPSRVTRDLLTADAGRRLASVLFRVLGAGEVEPDDPEGFRLTHQQLGEMANLSRHHVGRKLSAFEAAGWIACGYNRIRLLDTDGLAAFAYGDE
jgi:CRP-like cAMP-binding protein